MSRSGSSLGKGAALARSGLALLYALPIRARLAEQLALETVVTDRPDEENRSDFIEAYAMDVQLQRYYMPPAFGGEFRSFEEVGALVRVLSRRDPTVAIAHAINLLGAAVVWLAGDLSQQRALATSMLEGEWASVAVSEPASGSDLLAMTTAAWRSGDEYHLTGEKWAGNVLGRHRFVVVYARTAERGGPRGFTLFLLDRQAVSDGVRASGRSPTPCLGRASLSGLRFDSQLPGSAVIGSQGGGFEVMLKALQSARLICCALSLGTLDATLEIVLRFALQHKVHDKRVAELSVSQRLLGEAWAELLVCESVTGVALRGLHAVPSQASVHSAVVKYVVPTLVEQAIQKLSLVYDTHYYLPHSDDPGILQVYRDHLVVNLFDGSPQINLFSLSQQLRRLVIQSQVTDVPAWARHASEPPELDWSKLALSANGQDAVLASFEAGCDALRVAMRQHASDEECRAVGIPLLQLLEGRQELFQEIRQRSPGAFAGGDRRGIELARRYCVVSAASAVLADCLLNREVLMSTLADPAVITVVLHRLAAQLGNAPSLPTPCYHDCFAVLLARYERGQPIWTCAV